MRGLLLAAALLATIFAGNRIAGAAYQCAGSQLATQCFVHDVTTGEDL
jgi:hypothetical protein